MPTLAVSELNQIVGELLGEVLGGVKVVGEISNFTQARSGHRYFTLKDDGGQVACVLWKRAIAILQTQ